MNMKSFNEYLIETAEIRALKDAQDRAYNEHEHARKAVDESDWLASQGKPHTSQKRAELEKAASETKESWTKAIAAAKEGGYVPKRGGIPVWKSGPLD